MNQDSGNVISSRQGDASPAHIFLRTVRVTGAAVIALTMFGCSISTSISDSVSSPFKSSASSSAGKEEAYQADVRDYTDAYVRSSSDIEAYKKGLASLANKHGITNWEADMATYSGIGEGLGKANVSEIQLEVYRSNISKGDAAKASAIQKGYEKYLKDKQN